MATPSLSDLILYTNTPLTDTDYEFNWNKLISYLTDGTENYTIGNLTCKAITGVGAVGITGTVTATAFVGDGAGITNQTNILYSNTLVAETDTITVPSLNGLADKEYEISLMVKVGSGGAGALLLLPNNVSGAGVYSTSYIQSTTPPAVISYNSGSVSNGIQIGALGVVGTFAYITGTLKQFAVNGYKHYNGITSYADISTISTSVTTFSGAQQEPTNTTSLVLKTAVANGFGIGTTITVSIKK